MAIEKVFLDTNIVLDIIDNTRKSHFYSLKLLEYFALKDYIVCISEDMLTTLFYISNNKKQTLNIFKNLIFIDWNIFAFGISLIKKAIDLSLENNSDLEDTLQCLCAKENGCKILIINDKKFDDCGIKIMTSEEFLNEKEITPL